MWIPVYVAIIFAYVLINYTVVGIKNPGVYMKRKYTNNSKTNGHSGR